MSTYATDTFAGDGSTVEFTLTFSYLSRDHIKVFRIEKSDGAETELTVITTGSPTGDEFIWESDNKIKVGTAPTVDQTLKIQRDTPEDQQLVPWSDGSYLISEDLNDSDKQWLYNIQELSDEFAGLSFEAIKYRGTIDLTVDAAPASPQNGDYYINSGSGTVVASWAGIAGDNVQGSEQVIYNSSLNEWQILETPASQKGVLEVTGTAPIQVDNTDAQRPVVSVDAATTTDPGVINEAASDGVTYGRENGAWVAVANTAVSANPPANPSNGDGWYDLNTGRLFLWVDDGNSSQWAEANPGLAGGGGASVEVDDTPPTSPSEGDLWWDSSDGSGRLYVWYTDGDSDQWVEASPQKQGSEFWGRAGTTLSPATAGDDVDLGTGDLSAAAVTTTGNATIGGDLSAVAGTFAGNFQADVSGAGNEFRVTSGTNSVEFPTGASMLQINSTGGSTLSLNGGNGQNNVIQAFAGNIWYVTGVETAPQFIMGADGSFKMGPAAFSGSPNITLNANGSANFNAQISVNGINGRQGGGGTLSSSYYNFFWTGTSMQMWVDQVNLGDVNYTSDYRVKRNVTPLADGAIDRVKQLKPVSFQWKDYEVIKESDQVLEGFIAHEVQEVIPSGASGEKDKEHQLQSLRLDGIVSVLTKALQESITRIEALEAEVQSLKGGSN